MRTQFRKNILSLISMASHSLKKILDLFFREAALVVDVLLKDLNSTTFARHALSI